MTTPTKLQLYNQALRLVGEGKLATVTDNRPERFALDSIWDEDPVKQMLEETYWNFATRTMEWNYNSAIEPDFGYSRAFDKPANFVRTVAICSDEFFTAPLLGYCDEAGYWYCDLDTIYIKYVSDADDYGRDMSLWTELFRNCVATKMAKELAISLTKSLSLKDDLSKDHNKYLKEAKSLNAQEKPTQFLPAGRWIRSRSGGRSSGMY
jgi:hypothetical protein